MLFLLEQKATEEIRQKVKLVALELLGEIR
jgi:hypothetical protein